MALLFVDSFDHYSSPQILNKWTSVSNCLIDNSTSRTGPQCMEVGGGITKTIANRTVFFFGAAVNFNVLGGSFGFDYISNGQGFMQLVGDGTFEAITGTQGGGGGAVLGRSDPRFAVVTNRYYYLEFGLSIGVTGSMVIRLNGQVILSVSGNTDPNNTGIADVLHISGPGGGAHFFMDDLYVCDNFGASNNNFLGDTAVGLIMPASDGHYTQWTPNPAGSHFSNVNEIPPDGDATYNSDATPGDIDSYHFQPVSTTRTYFGIQTNVTARKDDTGNRAFSPMARIGGVDFVKDPLGLFVNQTYIDYTDPYDTNPATGLAWTGADINGAEYGVKLIA